MERVTGIGGFFFARATPTRWRSGTRSGSASRPCRRRYEGEVWRQQEGATVFAPFPQDSQMIGPPEHTWMINFRVDDLDAMAEQLRRAGESVDVDPERYPNGRFAEVSDPEGNRIQLWQPMAPA